VAVGGTLKVEQSNKELPFWGHVKDSRGIPESSGGSIEWTRKVNRGTLGASTGLWVQGSHWWWWVLGPGVALMMVGTGLWVQGSHWWWWRLVSAFFCVCRGFVTCWIETDVADESFASQGSSTGAKSPPKSRFRDLPNDGGRFLQVECTKIMSYLHKGRGRFCAEALSSLFSQKPAAKRLRSELRGVRCKNEGFKAKMRTV